VGRVSLSDRPTPDRTGNAVVIERVAAPPSAEAGALLRVPPHSLEAETSLLGALLLEPEAIGAVAPLLVPDDFYRSAHARLYGVIRELFDRGEPSDALVVLRECERQKVVDEIGGREFLASLARSVATAANAEHYARIVREKSIARGLIRAAMEIQRAAYDAEGRGDELLEKAEHMVFELARTKDVGAATSVRDLLEEAFHELGDRDQVASGLVTGFTEFDALTTGLHAGELAIVAGRPSMGKTTFALNVAYNVAAVSGKAVAIYSLEMSKQQIAKNILASRAEVAAQKLRGGRFLSDDEFARLTDAANPLMRAPLYIDDTPALSPTTLRAKARRLKQKHDVALIVIDYLQLMEGGARRSDSRQEEISYISRSLKGLARELHVPIIAISQLNRAAETREDHKPRLSDLRESGALEQDADLICFLYRKHYYSKAESDRGLAEVIIAKQRNGPTDSVQLVFLDQFMRFDNRHFGSEPGR
jgi:replicative DNA helicase